MLFKHLRGVGVGYFSGTAKNDRYRGTSDADYALGYAGDDILTGNGGDDLLFGGVGRDTLSGGDGNDTLVGEDAGEEQSADVLSGGTGDDTITGGWNDSIDGGAGRDALILDFTGSAVGVDLDLTAAMAGGRSVNGQGYITGIEQIRSITGSAQADRVVLGAYTGLDSMLVEGAGGNDVLTGAVGNNVLYGGSGNDRLAGGEGDDGLVGGVGRDVLDGGNGNDSLSGTGGEQDDTVADRLRGGAGDDSLAVGWNDTADGGRGSDTLNIDLRLAPVAIDLDLTGFGTGSVVSFGSGTIRGMERLGFVTLTGAADRLRVGSGDGFFPYVQAGGGDDQVTSVSGAATIHGDGGDDVLVAAEGDDRLEGGDGADRLDGGAGNDWLDAAGDGAGADLARDTLLGGAGDDRITAGAGDTVEGGDGVDLLTLDFAGNAQGVTANLAALANGGTAIVEGASIAGVEDIEAIYGSALADRITLGAGFTIGAYLKGNGGDDQLTGTLAGEAMKGDEGNDVLTGLAGDDTLEGGLGDDVLSGGTGADRLVGEVGADRIDGGGGDDRIFTGTDYYYPNAADGARDIVTGGAGDDQIEAGIGDSIDGGDGADIVTLSFADVYGDGVALDFTGQDVGSATIAGGVYRDVERLYLTLSRYADTLVATGLGSVSVSGGEGDDRLTGSAGDDELRGGDGADVLEGGAGNDVLRGDYTQSGVDGDADTASYASAASGVTVSLAIAWAQDTGGAGFDTLQSIDRLVGSAFDDVLTGGDDAFDFFGIELDGGAGDDRLIAIGSASLFGADGSDRLEGGAENDMLSGDAGADVIDGGGGTDFMIGGGGDDVFRFGESSLGLSRYDTISDFAHGVDRVDLSAIDADQGAAGDQAFAFIGTGAFSGTAGELRYTSEAGSSYLAADVDGDGKGDLLIAFEGVEALSAGDFVL